MPSPASNKLHSRRGESLAEVLVAMLIIALAVLLLAGTVSAAGSINMQTRRRDEQFYAELSDAETFAADKGEQPVLIQELNADGTPKVDGLTISQSVTVYGGEHLLSYREP